jgi:hypothetical protein
MGEGRGIMTYAEVRAVERALGRSLTAEVSRPLRALLDYQDYTGGDLEFRQLRRVRAREFGRLAFDLDPQVAGAAIERLWRIFRRDHDAVVRMDAFDCLRAAEDHRGGHTTELKAYFSVAEKRLSTVLVGTSGIEAPFARTLYRLVSRYVEATGNRAPASWINLDGEGFNAESIAPAVRERGIEVLMAFNHHVDLERLRELSGSTIVGIGLCGLEHDGPDASLWSMRLLSPLGSDISSFPRQLAVAVAPPLPFL